MTQLIYTFSCPICRKLYRSDEPGEPCCTGPSEMRHEHEVAVMRLISIQKRMAVDMVRPDLAAVRARGVLLMPDMQTAIASDARRIVLAK